MSPAMFIFENIYELNAYWKECMTSDDVELCKMAMGMKKKLNNYWGTLENMNKMIFIASMLEPRY